MATYIPLPWPRRTDALSPAVSPAGRARQDVTFRRLIREGNGVNVSKPQLQTTIWTLLDSSASQREIERVTGIDRKTIHAYQKRFAAAANSRHRGEDGKKRTRRCVSAQR
jgi:hypothetical protein